MSERTARLDQLLREEISAIIGREIADPRIGFVTVTQVEVTPDLSHATVWVSVIGDVAERRASVRSLGRAMPFVRHRLGDLRLKKIPELHLREDDSAERGTRVMHLIGELEAGAQAPAPIGEPLPLPARVRGAPEPPAPKRRKRAPEERRAGQSAAGRPRRRRGVDPGRGGGGTVSRDR